MIFFKKHHLNRNRGAILLMTLGLLVVMVGFMFTFLEYAHKEIRYAGVSGQQTNLRQAAYSALDISLAAIQEISLIEEKLQHPRQGWGNPWQYAEINWDENLLQVTTTVTDESGKISLPNSSFELLRVYFEKSGIPLRDTDSLADALLDWTDADDEARFNGAESDAYKDLDPPYSPPNAPLSSYQELLLIEGFSDWFTDENGIPNERFQQFTNSFSLYDFSSSNINTLAEPLLSTFASLYNLDVAAWRQITEGFDNEAGTEDDQIISQEQLGTLLNSPDLPVDLLSNETTVLRLNILVSQGDMNFSIECVVSLEKKPNRDTIYPFTFLSLQENSKL